MTEKAHRGKPTGGGKRTMLKLEFSAALKRRLRRDPARELGLRTEDRLIGLIRSGNNDDLAVELAEYLLDETQLMIEHQVEVLSALWTWIADHLGEDALYDTICKIAELDKWQREHMAKRHQTGRTMTGEEYARLHEAEHKRAMRYTFTITEEPDRFKMVFHPCMTGRLRRLRDENGRPPACLGRTREPHLWSWGRAGVPYWCTRICTAERLSIEQRGYPFMVTECPEDDFAPCVRYLYKDPADIPERYYEVLGYKRDPARFK